MRARASPLLCLTYFFVWFASAAAAATPASGLVGWAGRGTRTKRKVQYRACTAVRTHTHAHVSTTALRVLKPSLQGYVLNVLFRPPGRNDCTLRHYLASSSLGALRDILRRRFPISSRFRLPRRCVPSCYTYTRGGERRWKVSHTIDGHFLC